MPIHSPWSFCFHRACTRAIVALSLASLIIPAGCKTDPPVAKEPAWPTLPLQQVQPFMQGTLYERIRFSGLDETPVYGYSLVANLHDTGGSIVRSDIRDYIVKKMLLSGFDSYVEGTYKNVTPVEMLGDKRFAIVSVEGLIPVGAREGQSFDVIVRAMPRSSAKSLAHGDLYQTDLSSLGLVEPSSALVHTEASVHGGPVFVNPAYALGDGAATRPSARASLLAGTVLGGGVARFNRPIHLQLRQPSQSTARLIEQIISRRWQAPTQLSSLNSGSGDVIAKALEEGLVEIYVPEQYAGDWKHFLGVVAHLYLDQSTAFTERKARELVVLAQKPGVSIVTLADISLCWEAMGPDILSIFEPLISDPNPDVAFAAARAAAFLDDAPARQALLAMALDSTGRYQLEAVRTLGSLPNSPEVNHMISALLNSDKSAVRIEAYHLLVNSVGRPTAGGDPADALRTAGGIVTMNIEGKFLLDVVPSQGPPMIYATSTGIPRIAVFGHQMSLQTPITFTAMDMRFSIASHDNDHLLTIFYRDPLAKDPSQCDTHNDLPEILARLGGRGPDDVQSFDLAFSDVVAIAQQLVASHEIFGTPIGSDTPQECLFELQRPRLDMNDWMSIPSENTNGRPTGGGGVITGQRAAVSAADRAGG
jgi:flagellar basal body P-ring protein FlgI